MKNRLTTTWLEIRAGARAIAHLRERGLAPADIRCVPAAAGGPKGLALLPFDRRLHEHWLRDASSLSLVGASIGAWRMAALAQTDAMGALDRLQHAYVREQNYRPNPGPADVSAVIRGLARAVLGARPLALRPGVSLDVLTSRARGQLVGRNDRAAFVRAAAANAIGRPRLAGHLERVVFHAGAPSPFAQPFDAFGLTRIALAAANAEDALLASGSIPLVCAPVRDIDGAPPGDYWDGGVIDYHLCLPYARQQGITLFPHFVPHVTPGWLDRFLPWRKSVRGHPWLDNVLLIAPSRAFLDTLPERKLPDRNDFYRFGTDHAARIRSWERAIAQCEGFADAAMEWLSNPRLERVRLL